jgi:hypothetical protein
VLAAGRLGGANADLRSHIGVALGVIRATWADAALSSPVREAIVRTLLDNLSKGQPASHKTIVLRAFADFGRYELRDRRVADFLDVLRRGPVKPPEERPKDGNRARRRRERQERRKIMNPRRRRS